MFSWKLIFNYFNYIQMKHLICYVLYAQKKKTQIQFIIILSRLLIIIILGRRAKKQAQKASSKIPDLKDHETVQKYFLQEVNINIITLLFKYFHVKYICIIKAKY